MNNDCGAYHRGLRLRPILASLTLVFASALMEAHGASSAAVRADTPKDAVGTADAFSDSIATGDVAKVRTLLLPEVLIYESGEMETSAEDYAGHHLPADIAFMAGMKREILSRISGGDGAASWVATKSRLRGQYKGKPVDLDSTETLILTFTEAGWRIAHIHWSSTTHREAHASH